MKESHPFEPRSQVGSPSLMMEESHTIKPKSKVPWNLQKSLPKHIAANVAEAKAKEEIRMILSEARDKFVPAARNKNTPLGVFAAKQEDGKYKVIGFGQTVDTEQEVKEIAVGARRAFYQIGTQKVLL